MSDQPIFEPKAAAGPRAAGRAPWIVASVAVLVALAALIAMVFGAGGGGSSGGDAGPGGIVEHGSSTPEGAVKLFAEAFAEGDLDAAASTFATTSMVDGYSFTANVERQAAVPGFVWLPAEDYRGVDLARRMGDIGLALTSLTRSALMPDQDSKITYSLASDDAMSAADFVDGLDPSGFAEISVRDVTVFAFAEGSKAEENQQTFSDPYGADSSRTASVLFDTANGTAALGLQVIEYDGSWYVWDLFGGMLGTYTRELMPISTQQYNEMVARAEQVIAGS